ncbi:MAG: hypothetical protein IKN30_08530 [Synergistaceae bacterium]|nr:hypothetical protein [Synergistaceae bacterium]
MRQSFNSFNSFIVIVLLFCFCSCVKADEKSYTKYADYTPIKADEAKVIRGKNSKVLVAFFSRSGNTHIEADAVSSASLKINSDGTTIGNAEQIAKWIAEETGGDLFLIQTEYTYPVEYDKTVNVGEGQDIDNYHPVLISHVENMNQYDVIFLVYPIWHYTLPVSVCAFLDEYDLSGKTIYAFTANAGSRFADSIQRIQKAEPNAKVIEGVAVSEWEMSTAKERISSFLHKFYMAEN